MHATCRPDRRGFKVLVPALALCLPLLLGNSPAGASVFIFWLEAEASQNSSLNVDDHTATAANSSLLDLGLRLKNRFQQQFMPQVEGHCPSAVTTAVVLPAVVRAANEAAADQLRLYRELANWSMRLDMEPPRETTPEMDWSEWREAAQQIRHASAGWLETTRQQGQRLLRPLLVAAEQHWLDVKSAPLNHLATSFDGAEWSEADWSNIDITIAEATTYEDNYDYDENYYDEYAEGEYYDDEYHGYDDYYAESPASPHELVETEVTRASQADEATPSGGTAGLLMSPVMHHAADVLGSLSGVLAELSARLDAAAQSPLFAASTSADGTVR